MMKHLNKSIIALSLSLILLGCSSQGKYYNAHKNLDNKSCPGERMDFDRDLAAEKRLQIALHKIKVNMIETAKENLDCALKFAPKLPVVHRVYAYYFEQVGEKENARLAYEYAMDLKSNDPETMNQYGAFLCKHGKYERAIDLFLKAIAIPRYAQVAASYENAGLCSVEAGEMKHAEKFFRKALSYNKNSAQSLIEMAHIYFERGQYEVARAYVARFSALSQHNARSLWLAMRIEKVLGNKDALGSYALKLERMFPDSEETAAYLEKKASWQR